MKKLFILCFIVNYLAAADEKTIGSCIILNGASSVGKSTLARALVEELSGTWEIAHHAAYVMPFFEQAKQYDLIPYDYTYEGLPRFFKTIRQTIGLSDNKEIKQAQWQTIRYAWKKACYDGIVNKIQNGTNVIVDDSLYSKKVFRIAQNALATYNPYFVFVHSPFEIIVERVRTRNASDDVKEHRYLNQVMYQYACCYTSQAMKNDETIDTLHPSYVDYVIMMSVCECELSPLLPTGDNLAKKIIDITGITEDSTYIQSRLMHDLIVNTHKHTLPSVITMIRDGFSANNASDYVSFNKNNPEMLYED